MSKAEFVRSFPTTTAAAKIVEAAKKKGMKLSPAYIYVIRSKANAKKKPNGKNGHKTAALVARVEQKLVDKAADEVAFNALVRRLGTTWAQNRLAELS